MLNQEYIDDKTQIIFNLRKTINAFKKYDTERKEYIKNLEHEIQDLKYKYDDIKSLVDEDYNINLSTLEDKVTKLNTRIKNLKLEEQNQINKINKWKDELEILKIKFTLQINTKSEEELYELAKQIKSSYIANSIKYKKQYLSCLKDNANLIKQITLLKSNNNGL